MYYVAMYLWAELFNLAATTRRHLWKAKWLLNSSTYSPNTHMQCVLNSSTYSPNTHMQCVSALFDKCISLLLCIVFPYYVIYRIQCVLVLCDIFFIQCVSALCDMHPMRALFLIPRNPPPKLKSRKWSVFICIISQSLYFFPNFMYVIRLYIN